MAIERPIDSQNAPEGKRIVYLQERDGGIRRKEFETGRRCRKYLGRHHDSVVAYDVYVLNEDGTETFVKTGKFAPRTERERQKDRAKLRRKRRARKVAKEAAKKEQLALRPTKW